MKISHPTFVKQASVGWAPLLASFQNKHWPIKVNLLRSNSLTMISTPIAGEAADKIQFPLKSHSVAAKTQRFFAN